MSDEHDQIFFALPRNTQRRIDKAFDAFSKDASDSQPPKKKRKTAHADSGGGFVVENDDNMGTGGFLVEDSDTGGGFIVEDGAGGGGFLVEDSEEVAGGGGGFVPEEASSKLKTSTDRILFSSIPSALQLLDLPPDDEQVLSVFRNAASGWDDEHARSSRSRGSRSAEDMDVDSSEGVGWIARDDWRAVCSILLEQRSGPVQPPSEAASSPASAPPTRPTTRGSSRRTSRAISMDADARILVEDSDDDQDPYQQESDEAEEEEDEYIDPELAASSSRRRRRRGAASANAKSRRHNSDSSEYESDDDFETGSGKSKPLTSRQKQTCLSAFALFFPDIDLDELPNKRIMIKDLQRVAGLLKEKLKAEEMVEMLETFSTQPDKSMSLEDFEKMMIAARLA